MVNPLINDGHLIGFWPLHEPSGSAIFYNYSPHLAGKPSGLSFDMKVHTCLPDTSTDEERSIWPGTTREVLLGTSGVPHANMFKAQGNHLLAAGAGEHHKVLIMGDGGQISREMLMPPRVAQSGFTAGFWVLPQSDGRLDRSSFRQLAKAHSLLTIQEDDNGWMMGVSGSLAQAAQTNTAVNAQNNLFAYALNLGNSATAGNANEVLLHTPIESGVPIHLTLSYRIAVDTSANNTHVFALYKNGRLAASGQRTGVANAATLTMSNTLYNIRTLCVGGSVEETDGTDRYKHATGWGHLISGVYFFNRVLHEGEILDLHGAGGLQPFEGVFPLDSTEISITDSKLLAYYPFWGPGYVDASANRWPAVCDFDEGDETRLVTTPGPFGRFGTHAFGAAEKVGLSSTSGLSQALADNRSFTIAGFFSPEDAGHLFPNNMLFSLGQTGTTLTTAPTEASMCFYVDTDSTNVRYLARFFPLGSHNTAVTELRGFDIQPFSETAAHVGIIYDDQTKGVALYVNGEIQQSGTLAHSLSDQVVRVVGSGFPLVFLNSISSTISADPLQSAGGAGNASSDFVVMGRPILASEMRFLAQSGIKTSQFLRTVHDPRLFGYWPCDSLDAQALLIPDRARIWNSTPANLVRGTNGGANSTWVNIQATDTQGPWYRRDEFSRRYSTPPELASQLPLGITSGVWIIHGGSNGIDYTEANAEPKRSSLSNFSQRFRPFADSRGDTCVTPYSYALSFDITPSGNIRAITPTNLFAASPTAGTRHNTVVHYMGTDNATTNSACYSYLTNNAHTVGQNPGTSGVTIVFEGRDTGTAITPLVSGNLPFGIPSKVLFHVQWSSPYYYADAANSVLDISLYINGVKSSTRRSTGTAARIWSNSDPTVGTQQILQFGGIICGEDNTPTNNISDGEVGLGENYLRNIFVLKGILSADDISYFATSGIINSPSFTGYTNQQSTTQVTVNHAALQGYYRFSGGVSGERDLSFKGNNLAPLARQFATNNPPLFNNGDNPAHNLRYLPGPLLLSDLGVQASGITYESNEFTSTVVAPPFAMSGEVFTRPDWGFAIGFWCAKRDSSAVGTAYNSVISFGNVPDDNTLNVNVIDLNHGWVINYGPTSNMAMHISQSGTGSLYMDPDTTNAAQSGTIVCGAFHDTGTIVRATNFMGDYRRGLMTAGHPDAFNHYLWSYDAVARTVTCYMNGTQVDQKYVSSGVALPLDPAARLISLLVPQTGVWNWNSNDNRADIHSVITDVCYFNAPITAAEARYIAFNGIDDAEGTRVSGIIGGYIAGQDTASGVIGGYLPGQDTASGIIGGIMDGSIVVSGMIGGYVSGIVFATGQVGAYIHGLDTVSGIIGAYVLGSDVASGIIGAYVHGSDTGSGHIAGYILGSVAISGMIGGLMLASAQCSGLIGGWILGGLSGNLQFDAAYTVSVIAAQDFDAMLEARQQNSADFDAKVVVFQSDLPPDVGIIIPGQTVTGLVPPFNQYFIGAASGLQGKTIEKTRWSFGDLTPSVEVAVSGNNFYPIQHRFTTSGIYVVKFEAYDSHGIHNSATRIINIASGIPTVIVSLSGQPRSGNAALYVDFETRVESTPPGVSISTQLLLFDDGQTSIAFNPTHAYTEPGIYKPVWCVRDSRGFLWCDSLESGHDQ